MSFSRKSPCCCNSLGGEATLPGPCNRSDTRSFFEDYNDGGACGQAAAWSETNINSLAYDPDIPDVFPFDIPPTPAPGSGGGATDCATRYHIIPQGQDFTPINQATPILLGSPNPPLEFYACWYEYLESPWIWPAGQKLSRMISGSGLGTQVQHQWNADPSGNITVTILITDFAGGTLYDAGNPGVTVALDTWHHHEIYFKRSTTLGSNDGRIVYWFDGNPVVDSGNIVNWVTDLTGNGNPFNFNVGLNTTWNGTGPGGHTEAPQEQDRWIDQVELHSQIPCDVELP